MPGKTYAVILAGGIGSRMGNSERPKQFMNLAGKPVIIHTIEKFMLHNVFEKIVVLCPKAWVRHAEDLIDKYIPLAEKIIVLEGGNTGNETLMNAIQYLDREQLLDDETMIIVHDAVRPFLSHRIIQDNINGIKKHDSCDTVIPATDTIVVSSDGKVISEIPNRSHMYQGQMPQSFKAKKLWEAYKSLSEEEKRVLTDNCKIMVLRGYDVHLIEGDVENMKITHPVDMRLAEALIGTENV